VEPDQGDARTQEVDDVRTRRLSRIDRCTKGGRVQRRDLIEPRQRASNKFWEVREMW